MHGWTPELTHRLRVLLHTMPFTDLRRGEGYVDEDRRHYDTLALALRVFDLIVERTGLDQEVDSATVRRILAPTLVAMDVAAGLAPDGRRHDTVVDRLLAALRNEAEAAGPFRLPYTELDADGAATRRTLSMHLVRDVHLPDGAIAMRLSPEAINLFLNALELDIEDAQAAAEALVQSQLERGKFDDAFRSARNAALQSRRYQEYLAKVFRETRRDVRRVDWDEAVPKLLDEASRHIAGRINVERNILSAAEAQREQLPVGSPEGTTVGEVCRLIRDCMERHVGLHGLVMRGPALFLDEQARQVFAPRRALELPELRSHVLEPMLTMAREDGDRLAEHALAIFCPPRTPGLFWLGQLVRWQLRPRRELNAGAADLPERDLESYGDDPLRYPEAVLAHAEAYLHGVTDLTTLEAVLHGAVAGGEPLEVLEAIGLRTLQLFAPDGEAARPIQVAAAGSRIAVPGFYGDDLLLAPPDAEVANGNASPAIGAAGSRAGRDAGGLSAPRDRGHPHGTDGGTGERH